MLDYKNGKIYKLVNNIDDKIYVGSTCTTLVKRKHEHKKKSKRCPDRRIYKHILAVSWDNASIILIENFPCESKDELVRRERYWYDQLKPDLNHDKPCILVEELEGYNKQYYEEHKEHINEMNKKYYEKHKEHLTKQQKEYNKNNKEIGRKSSEKYREKNKEWITEKRNEKKKETFECPCGLIIQKKGKKAHELSAKHKKWAEYQVE